MAAFRICLIGSTQPLVVDLPATDIAALAQDVAATRFLVGHMVEPDEHGVCPGVLIQTNRIQCVFEVG
ncbi:MAG TPA: hypothetical protein PKN09_01200 [Novosphingobium sp.]|nr:hypothetical protein [Novosphingobium sp.]